MTKLNKILIVALAAQIVFIAVVWTGRDATTIPDPAPVVGGFEPDEVIRIEIFDRRENDGDDGDPAVVLVRSGDDFAIDSAHGYSADGDRVDELLQGIASMSSREPIATSEGRARQLEVASDYHDRKLVFHAGDGETRTLYLGGPAGRGRIAARVAGETAIHAVPSSVGRSAPVGTSDWAPQPYFEVSRDDIESLKVETGELTAAFVRDDDGAWSLDEATSTVSAPPEKLLDPGAVRAIAGAVARIRLADVAGSEPAPEHGLDDPRARVDIALTPSELDDADDADTEEVRSGARERFTLVFGAEKDDRIHVRREDRPFVVFVRSSAVSDLLEIDAGGLFATEEEIEEDAAEAPQMPAGMPSPERMPMQAPGGGAIPPPAP